MSDRRRPPAVPALEGLAAALLAAGLLVPLTGLAAAGERVLPQIRRDSWKDCAFNDRVIPCLDRQIPGGLEIIWKDGKRMTYRQLSEKDTRGTDLLRDRLGGLWRRELFVQGNITLTNEANGNQVFVPLRFPCKPPLKGEVGYCRY